MTPVTRAEVEALCKNIDEAIRRVTSGLGPMRIPADPSGDAYIVLSDCHALLARLFAERDESVAALKAASTCMNDMHALVVAPDGPVRIYCHGAFAVVGEVIAKHGAS